MLNLRAAVFIEHMRKRIIRTFLIEEIRSTECSVASVWQGPGASSYGKTESR